MKLNNQSYKIDMTVCIAAKADDGKTLILAADQLATGARKIDGTQKILPLTSKIFVMLAGDDLYGREVYKRVIGSTDPKLANTEQWANQVKKAFSGLRYDLAEAAHLWTRGLDRNTWQTIQPILNREVVLAIDNSIQNHVVPETYLIVAGIDEDGTAHIFFIFPPGNSYGEFAQFQTAGAGFMYASNSLYSREYSSTMASAEAAYLVYEAKKVSEVAPGVGESTSMVIVTAEGSETLPQEKINDFDVAYMAVKKAELAARKTALQKVAVDKPEQDSASEGV